MLQLSYKLFNVSSQYTINRHTAGLIQYRGSAPGHRYVRIYLVIQFLAKIFPARKSIGTFT
jgi:hypothetical protein